MGIEIANVNFPCQHPMIPVAGPGQALALEGDSSDGGLGKGTFVSTGFNINAMGLNPDGGTPLTVDFAAPGTSTFALDWGADPTEGVTGTINVTLGDGGTIQGTFAGSYCGAY